jgi:superfamily II DNA or RNA helicase
MAFRYNKLKFIQQQKLKQQHISKQESPFVITNEYRDKIQKSAYIGQQGYTILKTDLDPKDIECLKKDLTLEPNKSYNIGGMQNSVSCSFPVYRENNNKMYLPRFYGIERYGLPCSNNISEGETIHIPFVKTIRDYQEKIIQVYLDHIQFSEYESEEDCNKNHNHPPHTHIGGGILEVPCGRGKTIMALKIISILKKKTLILVHKEFLMNQWIERIHDFLPSAKIGKIQGTIFDIDDKDIVIGMIQTLYDKAYASNTFSSFGLTIIDEVHRIGSEEFSKTLFKTITNYMLGISATVERKDGLTKLLYMFIGPKIYSEERKDEDVVEVRAVEYSHPDTEYNKIENDYMGNVMYSTMVSKISNFPNRTSFVVKILRDLIEENPNKQIIVLSQIRILLTEIYNQYISFATENIQKIGYYVGGMKKEELQKSEDKQIVLATYSMAAEALDIPSLNTLVMVSPKTDIIQSVGRILRTRSSGKLIIDIVDTHEVFQNQWKKRKTYYKKCGYGIKFIKKINYENMLFPSNSWKCLSEPKRLLLEDDKCPADSDEIQTENYQCMIPIEKMRDII